MPSTLHEALFDPKVFRLAIKQAFNATSKEDFSGQSPSLFVGHHNYPHIRAGLLSTTSYTHHDDPLSWSKHNTPITEIIRLRSLLINAQDAVHVKWNDSGLPARLVDLGAQAAMAIKPLDVDVNLWHKPLFRLTTSETESPMGPSSHLKALRLTSNPKIPGFVDKVVSDTDLKANEGLSALWKKGISEHQLSKLITAGTLGTKLQRRLVPTRWGITAVDDTIGKQLLTSLKEYPESDLTAYYGGFLGNYFLVLFFPQHWSFELFENYVGSKHGFALTDRYHDYELARGRSTYAHNTAGGYYAARLAVLEHLDTCKRKAGVLALRFITDEYWAPLGVWVVREAMRHALASVPTRFSCEKDMITYGRECVFAGHGTDISSLLSASTLLRQRREQTSLSAFISNVTTSK